MKTLRITIALLLALTAAACSVSPTGPTIDPVNTTAELDGQGQIGGGTMLP